MRPLFDPFYGLPQAMVLEMGRKLDAARVKQLESQLLGIDPAGVEPTPPFCIATFLAATREMGKTVTVRPRTQRNYLVQSSSRLLERELADLELLIHAAGYRWAIHPLHRALPPTSPLGYKPEDG